MKLRVLRQIALLTIIIALMAGGVHFHAAAQGDSLPSSIIYHFPDHFPEGIVWDGEHDRFLLGSLTGGPILAVTDDGTATPFIEFDEATPSIGLEIDAERDRLLVVFSDSSVFSNPASKGIAKLGAYDLATGEELWVADMGAMAPDERHFANDVAVDETTGYAYVTDSLYGAVFAVAEDSSVQVWIYNDLLKGAPGANGIEILPNGKDMIVANMSMQTLYLIGLTPPGDAELLLRPVEIDGGATKIGGDGIIFDENGRLTVVGRYSDASGYSGFGVVQLRSEDDWVTATTGALAPLTKQASTAALRGGAVYIIYPEFIALNTGQSLDEFTIQQVAFTGGPFMPAPEPAATTEAQ